jgi:hypothetical protein
MSSPPGPGQTMHSPSLYIKQHGPSQARRPLPLLPSAVQSTPAELAYEPPTPISLSGTPSPVSGKGGSSCALASSSQSEPSVLAGISHQTHRFPLLNRRRPARGAPPKSYDDVNLSLKDRECPVCLRQGCLLVSHKLYTSQRTSRQSQPAPSAQKESPLSFTVSVGHARIDPFFDLPIGNSDPEMQQHFRDFFTAQCSSMTSPVRIRAFDAAYCPLLIRQALADPALCHSFIAMAATYSAIHGRGLQAPDAKLFSIYDRTFRILRQQVSQTRASRPSDSTIMAAVNLLMCHGLAFGDKSAIAVHPAALKNLVDACGGIANLHGQTAALTLWAAFYVTLNTGKAPVFLEQAAVMPDIPLSNPPPAVYGDILDRLVVRGLISPALSNVCHNTCRLIELLEDRVSGNTNPARWEYFHYKRNTMAMRNGSVHAELSGSGTKAECTSLVLNLFMFLVLRLMPWKAPVTNLCDQLQTALLATDRHDYWGPDIDVLLWVLFTLAASAEHWPGKPWALRLLLNTLSCHYACGPAGWPPNWCQLQWLNLRRFVWSEVYLNESFQETCQELVTMGPSSPAPFVAKEDEEDREEELTHSTRHAVSEAPPKIE